MFFFYLFLFCFVLVSHVDCWYYRHPCYFHPFLCYRPSNFRVLTITLLKLNTAKVILQSCINFKSSVLSKFSDIIQIGSDFQDNRIKWRGQEIVGLYCARRVLSRSHSTVVHVVFKLINLKTIYR